MPFFSIIIPLFNKEAYILDTLACVFTQTFQDFEIIVMDDGSTDNGVVLVKKATDSRIKLMAQKNQGVSAARNNAILAAQGKYIALLDADDLWLPDHLEGLHQLIEKFPEAGLYCCRYAIKYSENYTKDVIFSLPVAAGMSIIEDYFATSMINPIAWTSAVAFRAKEFIRIGQYDTKLRTAEDVDLFVRFALKFTIAFNNKATMIYEKNTTLYSLSKVEYNDERSYFLSKYISTEKNNPSLKRYLDLNRAAVSIRSKMTGNAQICEHLLQDIDPANLNLKQKILLRLPAPMLRLTAKMHRFLIRNRIYIKPLR